MNLLDQMLRHDSWTTKQLLESCQSLTDEQLDREFDIGHRSLRATFEHLIRNMEVWSAIVAEVPVAPAEETADSVDTLLVRLEAASIRLTETAHKIEDEGRWDESYCDPLDGIEKKFGTTIAHVMTHSMHHRAQLLYLMRQVGLQSLPEGDVFSWESAECKS